MVLIKYLSCHMNVQFFVNEGSWAEAFCVVSLNKQSTIIRNIAMSLSNFKFRENSQDSVIGLVFLPFSIGQCFMQNHYFWDDEVGDVMLLRWESIRQKSAKLDRGKLDILGGKSQIPPSVLNTVGDDWISWNEWYSCLQYSHFMDPYNDRSNNFIMISGCGRRHAAWERGPRIDVWVLEICYRLNRVPKLKQQSVCHSSDEILRNNFWWSCP